MPLVTIALGTLILDEPVSPVFLRDRTLGQTVPRPGGGRPGAGDRSAGACARYRAHPSVPVTGLD